jgi:hypothetical protein
VRHHDLGRVLQRLVVFLLKLAGGTAFGALRMVGTGFTGGATALLAGSAVLGVVFLLAAKRLRVAELTADAVVSKVKRGEKIDRADLSGITLANAVLEEIERGEFQQATIPPASRSASSGPDRTSGLGDCRSLHPSPGHAERPSGRCATSRPGIVSQV